MSQAQGQPIGTQTAHAGANAAQKMIKPSAAARHESHATVDARQKVKGSTPTLAGSATIGSNGTPHVGPWITGKKSEWLNCLLAKAVKGCQFLYKL